MTVIVDDGHLSRMIVVQILGKLGLQDEILVVECFHKRDLFLVVFKIFCKDSNNLT